MILVVNVCKERLHYYEFVRPILDILKGVGEEFFVRHYYKIKKGDLSNCDKIIICGTSLKDNKFLEDIGYFGFLRNFDKPVFGICAGMQILGLVDNLKKQVVNLDIKNSFDDVLKKKFFLKNNLSGSEIGFFKERFDKEFLGLKGEVEVYHLHNNYVEFGDDWDVFAGKDFAQAVRRGDFYGVLFHPEVRQKEIVREFVSL